MNTLWFYWGHNHLTYLRYMTLFSASRVHDNITLILRRDPIQVPVHWKERQDFQIEAKGHNWMQEAEALPIKRVWLEDFAPGIATLKMSDVHIADVLRWYLLAIHGGTVADMDIVFLKPLPEIKEQVQVVVFRGTPKPGYTPVSFVQGKPCDSWQKTFENAVKLYDPDDYESCGTKALAFEPNRGLPDCVVFPWAGLYPWSIWHDLMFNSPASDWQMPVGCCGIHWYAGHNQKFNQMIQGPEDLKNGAIAWGIKEVLSR